MARWKTTILEKLTVTMFHAIYITRRLITAFTRARHGSYPEPDETSSHLHTLFASDTFRDYLPIYA